MKDNLHPDYHEITVVMTDGTEFKTRSTYGEAGAKLHLDIDPKVHPAWTGQHRTLNRGGQLEKFNKRFSGISGGKKEAAAETASEASAAPAGIKLTTGASSAKKKG